MDEKFVIRAIEVNKSKNKATIKLSNNIIFNCDLDLILKHRFTKNKEVTSEELDVLKKDQELYELKQKALHYATYKPRTEKQVREKLDKLGFNSEESDYAVLFLKKFDYLNDERYATAIVNDWLKMRPASASRMIGDLCQRGVDRNVAKDVVNKLFPNDDIASLAENSAEKKMRALRNLPKDKQKLRLFNHLQRLGFNWDIINQIMKKYFMLV